MYLFLSASILFDHVRKIQQTKTISVVIVDVFLPRCPPELHQIPLSSRVFVKIFSDGSKGPADDGCGKGVEKNTFVWFKGILNSLDVMFLVILDYLPL